jgi:ABC-type glutathione transport system ATPase component
VGDAEPALLEVRDLVKEYAGRGGLLRRGAPHRAVDGVSFSVARGETLGLVGETGCGKTTVARMIAGLLTPTSGEVRFAGVEVAACRGRRLKALRRELQVVFQDPQGSLNGRKTVGAIVAEPFVIHGLLPERGARRRRVAELIEHVGLDPSLLSRRPADLSGGQRQRVGIARALALEPKLIIADEPVSALDVSVQAQILNLLRDLQRDLGLTLVFISHDLAVVRHMSDRIVVMQAGKAVEIADADELYANPAHAYTRTLLASVPGAPRHAGTEVTDAVDR